MSAHAQVQQSRQLGRAYRPHSPTEDNCCHSGGYDADDVELSRAGQMAERGQNAGILDPDFRGNYLLAEICTANRNDSALEDPDSGHARFASTSK